MADNRVYIEASKEIPANPIGEYGELYPARLSDSGDKISYGHGACYVEEVVEVDGKPCTIRYMVKKGSRRRGARQFIS
jgi:hypothetical protein